MGADSLSKYKNFYRENLKSFNRFNKFQKISLLIRCYLMMLICESLKDGKDLRKLSYQLRFRSLELNGVISNKKVPEMGLEKILVIFDYFGLSFFDIKKRILKDLQIHYGIQKEKTKDSSHEKDNKI